MGPSNMGNPLFEIVMYRQINELFIRSKFFTDKQSGYRSKRNCTTALIDVVEDIREKVDNSEIAYLLLLGHLKAFGTIDHKTLCHKLINLYNIGLSAVKLIFSYLNGRSQSIFFRRNVIFRSAHQIRCSTRICYGVISVFCIRQ